MAVPLIRAHGRKNSLRFSAAIFLLLRNKNDLNGRAPHRGTWPKKQPPLLCGYFLLQKFPQHPVSIRFCVLQYLFLSPSLF